MKSGAKNLKLGLVVCYIRDAPSEFLLIRLRYCNNNDVS